MRANRGGGAGSDGGCAVDEKECNGQCVSDSDPAFGCGPTSCTPCPASTCEEAVCDVNGTCSVVDIAAGNPAPSGQCAPSTCGNDGNCDGNGGCEQVASGTLCGVGGCSGGVLTAPSTCGGGTCKPGSTTSCGNYACNGAGTACLSNCASDAECAAGSYCKNPGDSGTCTSLGADGSACTGNGQCSSGVCDVSGTGNCCTAACSPTTAPCGATACDTTGACVFPGKTTACGASSCSGSTLTMAGACNGSGSCSSGSTGPCPGNFTCAEPQDGGAASSCNTTCSADTDCASGFSCQNPGAYGTCVALGGAGASCTANDQCESDLCGPTGSGTHCCAASNGGSVCPATVPACGATDCSDTGACVYPDNTVAPASLQTSVIGTCQQYVCDGNGGDTLVDDPRNLPMATTACESPGCCGPSPLTPCFTPADTGTPCTSDDNPPNQVCGDIDNSAIAGTCVECNFDSDCNAIDDAGILSCDTATGTCH